MRSLIRPACAGLPAIAAMATAGLLLGSSPATAEGSVVQRPAIVGASVMRWLHPSPKAAAKLTRPERKALARRLDSRHGRGSHICTASGFGNRPSCFAR